MSYKKIVAGVATFAVAASLVAPAAFAASSSEYREWAKADIEKTDKELLETAANKAGELEIAKNELEIANTKWKNASDSDKPTEYEKVLAAEKKVEDAQKAFEEAEAKAAAAVTAAKVALEVAPAHKVANEHAEKSLKAADALAVKINKIDLTYLEPTYKEHVVVIQYGLKKLETAKAALKDYKKMAPNKKELLASNLDQVMAEIEAALGKIKNTDLQAATKPGAPADAKKSGKALPKTGKQAPVAPFAGAAAAALIAAGLVASRKVNA